MLIIAAICIPFTRIFEMIQNPADRSWQGFCLVKVFQEKAFQEKR